MADVTIDIPGVGLVVADNAASEATLRAILAAISAGGAGSGGSGGAGGSGSGGSGGAGSGGSGGAGGAGGSGSGSSSTLQNILNGSIRAVTGSFGLLGTAIGGTVSAVSGLTSASLAAATSMSNLATSQIESYARLGSSINGAAAKMAELPVFGSLFGKSIMAVAYAQTDLIKNFRSASVAGAAFASNMSLFAASATAAGLTVGQYSAFISANGEAMRALSSTTEDGAKRFSILSNALRSTSSELYNLGYSSADFNKYTAMYIKTQQASTGVRNRSDADIVAGTKVYMRELDLLAKITGKNREDLASEKMKLSIDPIFASFTRGIDNGTKESAASIDQLSNALKSGGPIFESLGKEAIASGIVQSEQNQILQSQLPATMAAFAKVRSQMQNHQDTTAAIEEMRNAYIKEGIAITQEGNQAAIGTLSAYAGIDSSLSAFANAGTEARQMQAQNIKAAKDQLDTELQAKQKMIIDNAKFEASIAALSNKFNLLLSSSGVFTLLTRAFEVMGNVVDKILTPIFMWMGTSVGKIVNTMDTTMRPMFNKLGTIADAIPDILSIGFSGAFEAIGGLLNGLFTSSFSGLTGSINILDLSTVDLKQKVAVGLKEAVDHSINWLNSLWISTQEVAFKLTHFAGMRSWDDVQDKFTLFTLAVSDVVNYITKLAGGSLSWETLMSQASVSIAQFRVGIDDVISSWNTMKNAIIQFTDIIMSSVLSIAKLLNKLPDAMGGMTDATLTKIKEAKSESSMNAALSSPMNNEFEKTRAAHLAELKKATDDQAKQRTVSQDEANANYKQKLEENANERAIVTARLKNREISEDEYNKKIASFAEDREALLKKGEAQDAARDEYVKTELANVSTPKAEYESMLGEIKNGMDKGAATKGDFHVNATKEGKAYYNELYAGLLASAKVKGAAHPEALARLGAAQSALETGHGKHAPGNNAFGIKGTGPAGTQQLRTHEFIKGKMVSVRDYFKKYNSLAESADDYIDKILSSKKRYKGVAAASTPASAIAAQGRTGYATDSAYAAKLRGIDAAYNKESASAEPISTEPVLPENTKIHEARLALSAAALALEQTKLKQTRPSVEAGIIIQKKIDEYNTALLELKELELAEQKNSVKVSADVTNAKKQQLNNQAPKEPPVSETSLPKEPPVKETALPTEPIAELPTVPAKQPETDIPVAKAPTIPHPMQPEQTDDIKIEALKSAREYHQSIIDANNKARSMGIKEGFYKPEVEEHAKDKVEEFTNKLASIHESRLQDAERMGKESMPKKVADDNPLRMRSDEELAAIEQERNEKIKTNNDRHSALSEKNNELLVARVKTTADGNNTSAGALQSLQDQRSELEASMIDENGVMKEYNADTAEAYGKLDKINDQLISSKQGTATMPELPKIPEVNTAPLEEVAKEKQATQEAARNASESSYTQPTSDSNSNQPGNKAAAGNTTVQEQQPVPVEDKNSAFFEQMLGHLQGIQESSKHLGSMGDLVSSTKQLNGNLFSH